MPEVEGFVGGDYESRAKVAANQACINTFPEAVHVMDAAQLVLTPVPGLVSFASGLDATARGLFAEDGRCFAVFGPTLYEIDSTGSPTVRGTMLEDTKPVTFATNGDGGRELFITSADRGYIFDLDANTLTQVRASGSEVGGVLNGKFVTLDAATSTMALSDNLDGTTWDTVQEIQRTSATDPWVGFYIHEQEVFLFGKKTGEVYYDAGASPVPFRQRPGAQFDIGVEAVHSFARLGNSFCWLGSSAQEAGGIYMMRGYEPVRISNPAIDYQVELIRDAGGVDDAVGWSYGQEGHEFYLISFPQDGRTYAYDLTTGIWHRRQKWDSMTSSWKQYRALFHAIVFNRNLVCDALGGAIYDFSTATYVDADGEELRRVRRSPHMGQENALIFYDLFELYLEEGPGVATGQGADPEVMMRYSNDGGRTWSSWRTRKAGKIGEYGTRARWLRCGSGRDRVWEIAMTDPVGYLITGAAWKGRPAAH
jgi:hypothetical protein